MEPSNRPTSQAPVYREERKYKELDREREIAPKPAAPSKLALELHAKVGSAEKVGIRLYLRDASAATLNKLKAAGLHIIAQPGGAKLVIGEIIGTKLMALAAIEEVQLISPR
jgi:hypothetical protein